MKRTFTSLMTLAALAAAGMLPGAVQAASNTGTAPAKTLAEVSITYSALRANAPVGGCGCFWMNGGTAELAIPAWKYFSGVAELSGEHTGHIPQYGAVGLSLLSAMGGVRISRNVRTRYVPFAQTLVGGVHAFGSEFPGGTPFHTSASSFAMVDGVGLDLALTHHVLIRPIQAEYQYMQLPNNSTDQQHDVRLSAGIVYRFTH